MNGRPVEGKVSWTAALTDRALIGRSLLTCVVVGAVLTAINHGSDLLRGEVSPDLVWQVPLTFLVPFLVATVSSAATIRSRGWGSDGHAHEAEPDRPLDLGSSEPG